MAPKMLEDDDWSEKSDIYALGIMIWEMLSGKQPHKTREFVSVTNFVESVCQDRLRPDIIELETRNQELEEMMTKCWEHNVDDRLSTRNLISMLGLSQTDDEVSKMDDIEKARQLKTPVFDGNGELDLHEFFRFIDELTSPNVISCGKALTVFDAIDVNKGGTVSFLDEFLPFWTLVTSDSGGLETAIAVYSKGYKCKEKNQATDSDSLDKAVDTSDVNLSHVQAC